jgi:hypothetical protein
LLAWYLAGRFAEIVPAERFGTAGAAPAALDPVKAV